MTTYTSADQRKAALTYIERTGAASDSITYPQLFAAAGLVARPSNPQYAAVAAEILGLDAAALKAIVKRTAAGNVIIGLRVRPDREIPAEALARFDKDPGEPPSEAAGPGFLPYDAARAQAIALRPLASLDPLDALETASISSTGTTSTMGNRIGELRLRMAAPAANDDERLKRLEDTMNNVVEAINKINATLKAHVGAFNHNKAVLDATQQSVVIVRDNVRAVVRALGGDEETLAKI